MTEDYKRKYQDLQRQFKKQQHTINKLQHQINERARNYLNHQASKRSRDNQGRQDYTPTKMNQTEQIFKSQRNSERSLRLSKEYSECESMNGSKLDFDVITQQQIRDKKKAKLKMSKMSEQIELNAVYRAPPEKKQAQILQIIDPFKQRIAAIQKAKNDMVKELEKSQSQNKQMRFKISQQQRQLQKTVKSESKLKQKLKKMPQYEQSINEIYNKLMIKIKGVEQNNQHDESEKHINQKIEDILKWVEESMGKVDVILENINTKTQLEEPPREESNQEEEKKDNTERENFQQPTATYQLSEKKAWSTVKMPMWTIQSEIKVTDDHNVSQFSVQKAEEDSIIRSLEQHSACLQQQVAQLKYENMRIKQELIQSRKKIPVNKQVKLAKEIDQLKHELQASKLTNSSQLANSRKMSVEQQLEPPYYVQEEMQVDTNHQYVKRSFVRKKIVRRNLSATAYRVVSKSKEEVNAIVQSKLQHYSEKSKEKAKQIAVKLTREAKMQALKNSLKDVRVSEVSRESDSRPSEREDGEEIKIVELTTTTPSEQITSTKIYANNKEQTISFRKKL